MDSRQELAIRNIRDYLEARKALHDLVSDDDTIHAVFPLAPIEDPGYYLTVSDLEELLRIAEWSEAAVATPDRSSGTLAVSGSARQGSSV
jgi:hypothetical protein